MKNIKKIVAILCAAFTVVTAFGTTVVSADNFSHQNFNYVVKKDPPMTRWIGRNDKKATDFLANCGNYDRVLYLSDELVLSAIKAKSAVSSNKKVIKVEDGKLIPVSQGKATVTFKLKNGTKKKEVIAVTTYNDGKNPKTARSISELDCWALRSLKASPEQLKKAVHTIQDAIFAIEILNLRYDFAIDDNYTYFQWGDQDLWMATATGPTVIERGGGVCRSAAEIGLYLLQDDFEDAGCIQTKGEVGHIFDWFYEDGKYIVFDFTRVFSDNVGHDDSVHYKGTDYWKQYIEISDSIDELKKGSTVYNWVNKNGDMNSQTWAVMMYSALGHDYMPIWYDYQVHDMKAAQQAKTCIWGFQKEVADTVEVLFKKPGWDVQVKSFKYKDLRYDLKLSNRFYGYHTEIVPW